MGELPTFAAPRTKSCRVRKPEVRRIFEWRALSTGLIALATNLVEPFVGVVARQSSDVRRRVLVWTLRLMLTRKIVAFGSAALLKLPTAEEWVISPTSTATHGHLKIRRAINAATPITAVSQIA